MSRDDITDEDVSRMSRDNFTHEDVSRLLLEVMNWVYGGGPLTPDETAVLDRVRAALAEPSDDIEALRRENKRLREALKAETARCAKVCSDAANEYEVARRGYWNPGLDSAVRALQNAAADILKGAA